MDNCLYMCAILLLDLVVFVLPVFLFLRWLIRLSNKPRPYSSGDRRSFTPLILYDNTNDDDEFIIKSKKDKLKKESKNFISGKRIQDEMDELVNMAETEEWQDYHEEIDAWMDAVEDGDKDYFED